ncbi:hypothetical protein NDU88_006521 [Pleurodeles waltl]|uniref:Uncharacterized protein n=1 Tax=Pleurodeles waltl TaxID=8319 RepID=A0AAV7VPW1_PLEWA|nr:hypothetical protein NDU88_006521 [Pleurodeles waltl]
MLHNLALYHHVPFLQEVEAGVGHVAAVDPVDSEDEEAEDEDNRSAVIRQYFKDTQNLAQRILGMLVGSQDRGECLLEGRFPGPVLPLPHSSPPSFPVVLCFCPLNRVPTATDPRSLIVLGLWCALGSL